MVSDFRPKKQILASWCPLKDKQKIVFTTSCCRYHFTVKLFGLSNHISEIYRIGATWTWKTDLAYQDDDIVMGYKFQKHLKNLQDVSISFEQPS